MKVAIIGSRGITSLDLSNYLPEGVDTIVSGGARGVDSIAAAYAKDHGIRLVEFLPDYDKFGKGAPLKRNHQIIEAADLVLAFWDGHSRGTAYTIREARNAGKEVRITYTDGYLGSDQSLLRG